MFLISAFLFILLGLEVVSAAGVGVAPAIIDVKAKPRDIIKESVTLTNTDNFKQTIYTFVNSISSAVGKQAFVGPATANLAESLANWVEISRGVIELRPGQTKEIEFSIRVDLGAKPGMYHGVLTFAPGGSRLEAERRLNESPTVGINAEILDDGKEGLQLKKFISDKRFFSDWPVSFSLELKNIGNRTVTPRGEIRIYDRKGEEVTEIAANQNAEALEPKDSKLFKLGWSNGKGIGRYKALLNLEYGEFERGILQDTIFFWIFPWPKILIIFGGLAAVVVVLTIFTYSWLVRSKVAKKV